MIRNNLYIFCFVALLLQGCISDDLNLKRERELAISIGEEGLTLPGLSSFDIPLSQLISVSEDSELTIDSLTGDFLFYKCGDEMDSTTICIGQGSVCDGVEAHDSISFFDGEAVKLTPNKRFPEFASIDFECVVTPHYQPDLLKDGIVDVKYIETDMTIDFDFVAEGVNGLDYIDQIEYTVPSFYDLVDESELIEYNVPASQMHSHQIHIKGVRFGDPNLAEGDTAMVDPIWQRFCLAGKMAVKGSVKNVLTEDLESSVNPLFHLRVWIGTLGTNTVTGRFNQREVIDFPPIEFHDLPEFIQDEEVEIDIENPVCRLSLESKVPANVFMNTEIIGTKDGEEISHLCVGNEYGTEPIIFHGAQGDEMKKTNIWISRIPIETPDSVDQNIVIPAIADIMRHIPDQFSILLSASTDSSQLVTLSLSEEYVAIPRYELVAPLKMGPNMKIVYTKEVEELGDKIAHLDFSKVLLAAKAINRLPLDVQVTAVAYDADGEEIDNLHIDTPASIPAFEERQVAFSLWSEDYRLMKQIDRVCLKIYATSSEKLAGITLNKDHNFRMEELTISIK